MKTVQVTVKERDLKLVETFKKTMNLYRKAIEMEFDTQQRLIIQYVQSLVISNKELECIHLACEKVLMEFDKEMPHDSTMIDEVKKLLKPPYDSVFPKTFFDEDVLVYKMFDCLIKELFDAIPIDEFNRQEQYIVKRLWKAVHCTLVDNPNFKGENPYYQRHYRDMMQSKKLWLELLDNDFNVYIEYFSEDVEGD